MKNTLILFSLWIFLVWCTWWNSDISKIDKKDSDNVKPLTTQDVILTQEEKDIIESLLNETK